MKLRTDEVLEMQEDIQGRTEILCGVAVKFFSITELPDIIKTLNKLMQNNLTNNWNNSISNVAQDTLNIGNLITFLAEVNEESNSIHRYQSILKKAEKESLLVGSN